MFCNVIGHYEPRPIPALSDFRRPRFANREAGIAVNGDRSIRERGVGDMQRNDQMDQGGDGGMHTCPTCGKSFDSQQELMAHQREAHDDQPGQTMPETGE